MSHFGAEGWAVIIAALGVAVSGVIGTWRTGGKVKKVHDEIQIPSNRVSLGALVEGQAQVVHMLTQLLNPNPKQDLPSPVQIGRRLQDAAANGAEVSPDEFMRPGEALPPPKKGKKK